MSTLPDVKRVTTDVVEVPTPLIVAVIMDPAGEPVDGEVRTITGARVIPPAVS